MSDSQPVALVMDARRFVGPDLTSKLLAGGFRVFLQGVTLEERDSFGEPSPAVVFASAELDQPRMATRAGSDAMVRECIESFGRIDAAFVRSADFVDGPFLEATDDDHNRMRLHIDVCFHSLQAIAASMTTGQIVVGTSAHGERPTEGHAIYAAARASENALARAVGRELAPSGITVNAVATNFMRFPEFRGGWRDEYEQIANETPRKMMGEIAELADLISFLMEGRSPHLVGQVLTFDGGWS
ncbi:SDR family NAD(P)-dependent oxidoreductase [Microbacterium yannicii]|uniref:SDR family NAD(P)-dependent oxidoreductase n=1 Tax=Microbacterium yannicii TaxID=671622 RepID=UPI00037E0845|nr:SDR family oxidoreductase [Microbacterium yannicii]